MATYKFLLYTGELVVKSWQTNPTTTAEGPVVTTVQIPQDSIITSAILTVNLMIPANYKNDADLDVYFNNDPVIMNMSGDKSGVDTATVTSLIKNGYNVAHLEWTRNAWASGLWDQMCKVRVDLEVTTQVEPMDIVRLEEDFFTDLQSVLSHQMDAMLFLQKYQWPVLGGGAVLTALAVWQLTKNKKRKR